MTLWQDPPPQTRRQARESERAAAERADAVASPRRAATVTPTTAGEIPQVSSPFVFSSTQRESTTDTLTASSEAQSPPPVRPRLPRYDALPFDAVLNQPPAGEDVFKPAADLTRPEPVTAPVPMAEQPRHDAPEHAPAPHMAQPIPFPVPQSPVQQTPVQQTPVQQTPVQHASAVVAPVTPEHTLTRRELRAMLQAQEANQQAAQSAAPEPIPFPSPQPVAAEPQPAPVVESEPSAHDVPTVSPEVQQVLERGVPAAEPIPASPVTFAPVSAPHATVAGDGPAEAGPATDVEVTPSIDETEVHHRRSFQPPTGHWSLAAAQDDDDDHTPPGGISRSAVSSGAATTSNALIMPIVPSVADATGPLTSTGEILVTGSIDLPRGLGSTGQHPDHFDTSDLDRMFDQPDALGEANMSVAPVRASRAVSTHTSTRGMITPPNRRGSRLPMTLAITAAVLALGVVGLLVAGYVFHIF